MSWLEELSNEALDSSEASLPQDCQEQPAPYHYGRQPLPPVAVPEDARLETQDAINEAHEEVYDGAMSAIQLRLEKANLYQQWIKGDLYDLKTQSTVEVEEEFKAFALKQLNRLIGLESTDPAVEPQHTFSDLEIKALQLLAQAIIKNPKFNHTNDTAVGVTAPVSKKLPGRPAKAVSKPLAPPQKPVLKKKAVPKDIAPTQLHQVATKPMAPTAVHSAVRPTTNPHSAFFANDGEIFKENGKTFEVKWVPTNSNEYGPSEGPRMEAMAPETTLKLKNGISVYRTVGMEFYKIIKMDKSPKVKPTNALPFPSVAQMGQVTAMAAARATETIGNAYISD
jgi:hypothetical protein